MFVETIKRSPEITLKSYIYLTTRAYEIFKINSIKKVISWQICPKLQKNDKTGGELHVYLTAVKGGPRALTCIISGEKLGRVHE